MSIFRTQDGVNLYYKDWGQGQPILFSHGWPLNADMWDVQMNFFAERNYRTIAFDRRGFGRSDQPWQGYDYNTFTSDLHALIEYLQLSDIILIGFSMGGGEVSRYISTYGSKRIKALILLGSITPILRKTNRYTYGVEPSVFDNIKKHLFKDRAQFIKDFADLFYGNSNNTGHKISQGILTHMLNMALLASLKATVDCVTAFSETNFSADLEKIDVPTLIIHGSGDQIVPYKSTSKMAHKQIKSSMLKIYEGAPHGFTVTHQDSLNKDLLEFLAKIK
ncbi:alpha/beta fold hydrolase [Candidatus Ishikawella capsulata]|uniref:2-hydroxy-6-ketonona-2,4-dienedioic acid hydrolase n=1 Tax=Candidatus Ishikawaella capsulata Mpkobe TaxID=476281 RepID=C5WD57_9ENTR|nr:alpha/beta hydrolase [Candidatus Ishikawaella capsulata]BAH83263.1 2-hydroxy-6-ketonona-2,4-dienedioic acid hydrolase [Candidatus Ishikawaella capsulata Mpkobe]